MYRTMLHELRKFSKIYHLGNNCSVRAKIDTSQNADAKYTVATLPHLSSSLRI